MCMTRHLYYYIFDTRFTAPSPSFVRFMLMYIAVKTNCCTSTREIVSVIVTPTFAFVNGILNRVYSCRIIKYPLKVNALAQIYFRLLHVFRFSVYWSWFLSALHVHTSWANISFFLFLIFSCCSGLSCMFKLLMVGEYLDSVFL